MTLQSKMDFSRLDVRLILKHILGWGLLIVYEISFISITTGSFFPLKDYVCYYGLNIILFYVNAHVILSYAIKSPRSGLLIPVLMFLEMLVYLFFKYILDYFLAAHHLPFVNQLIYVKKFLVPNAYRGVYFLGFSTLYWAILRMIAFRKRTHETETLQLTTLKEKAEVERNLAEARNAYLQHQINPHLLFNTLTFIHNTYYKFSREASQCVLLLVDIMRFSLHEVDTNGKTPLIREIEQIRNFIELNQLRFDYELYIDFEAEGDFEEYQIIPLILLTLTENIFKHGNLKRKEDEAKIHISISDQHELNFASWNLKKHQSETKRLRSIGIKNVIKRLEYSYRHQYSLNIKEEDDSYRLELRMQL
jgi:two-component system LytT family sensor kinase